MQPQIYSEKNKSSKFVKESLLDPTEHFNFSCT